MVNTAVPNPWNVILNLVQNLLRKGLFKHLINSVSDETLKQVGGDNYDPVLLVIGAVSSDGVNILI